MSRLGKSFRLRPDDCFVGRTSSSPWPQEEREVSGSWLVVDARVAKLWPALAEQLDNESHFAAFPRAKPSADVHGVLLDVCEPQGGIVARVKSTIIAGLCLFYNVSSLLNRKHRGK